ncbi:DUF481 domain-containing protein [Candidatus Binatia bacterium]|nr:DUF481 domain-containing protein [Candidatus Binatia bacterium]
MQGNPRWVVMSRQKPLSLAIAICALVAGTAAADEITAKGDLLRGTISDVTSTGVAFTPDYGKGDITIEYSDIQNLKTDAPMHVLHGEDATTVAPISGYSDGKLLMGDTQVPVDSIAWSVTQKRYDDSMMVRLRQRLRFWTGNFDIGFSYTAATINTSQILVGLGATRTKGPFKLGLGASTRYGTQKPQDKSQTTTQNDVRGIIRGDYSFTDNFFGFTAADALYDAIQKLSIRTAPRAGLGYKVYNTKTAYLQFEAGAGYLYERYFGGSTNDYPTAVFGVEAYKELPRDARFKFRTDYLPAFGEWADNYLLRTDASLLIPFWDPFAIKFTLLNEYDSTPAPDTKYNSLALFAGFTVVM